VIETSSIVDCATIA